MKKKRFVPSVTDYSTELSNEDNSEINTGSDLSDIYSYSETSTNASDQFYSSDNTATATFTSSSPSSTSVDTLPKKKKVKKKAKIRRKVRAKHRRRKRNMVQKRPCIFNPFCCYEACNLRAWCETIAMVQLAIPVTLILSNLTMFDDSQYQVDRESGDLTIIGCAQMVYFWLFFPLSILCVVCGSALMVGIYWSSKVFCLAHTVLALLLSLLFMMVTGLSGVLLVFEPDDMDSDHNQSAMGCICYFLSAAAHVYFSLYSIGLFTHLRAVKHEQGDRLQLDVKMGDLTTAGVGEPHNFVISFLKSGIHS